VHGFKKPSEEELDHDFLWRCYRRLPARGEIGIFNRSYYEEVLVVRVHPEYLGGQRLPGLKVNKKFWENRYESIRDFEKHISRNGCTVLKFFLNVSREEQKKRFMERLNEPDKNWKFSEQDVKERGHWDAYMESFEEALRATSTDRAPWYVIPADHKWIARSLVAGIIARTIRALPLEIPQVSPERRKALDEARRQLEAEKA
jgi:PPK2 family polyphosphate:nucleotide phosphotransferase